ELVPKASVTAMLVNPINPDTDFETRDVQEAANVLGHDIRIMRATQEPDFQTVFAALVEQRASALLVASDAFFSNQRTRLVRLAQRHAIPTMYDRREFPEVGGLISYGHHRADAYHQLGIYIGQVLKGAQPSDLPVLQPTRFELVVNLKTAKTLGLPVPDKLLVAADEVIE